MSIEELNATFCATKLGKPYSLQLTYPKDGKMRNIYVYAETGKVESPNIICFQMDKAVKQS